MNQLSASIPFTKRGFWDVDASLLDLDRDAAFIIQRIFEKGSWNDMKWANRYYGEQKILDILMDTRYLSDDALRMVTVLFNKEPHQFKCYSKKLQMKELGMYWTD